MDRAARLLDSMREVREAAEVVYPERDGANEEQQAAVRPDRRSGVAQMALGALEEVLGRQGAECFSRLTYRRKCRLRCAYLRSFGKRCPHACAQGFPAALRACPVAEVEQAACAAMAFEEAEVLDGLAVECQSR